MPANEQTWRDTKLLHVIFAVSSVAMLLTTLWMTADDNNRPWKDYQRKFIDLDARTTAFRAGEQESADFEKKQDELQKALDDAKDKFTRADEKSVAAFIKQDEEFTKRFAQSVKDNNVDFKVGESPEARQEILSRAADLLKLQAPADIRKARATLLEKMNDLIVHYYKFREDHFTIDTKNAKAYLSAVQSQFDQAVGHGAGAAELKRRQKAVDQADAKVTVVTALMQAASQERKDMEMALGRVTEKEDAAKKELDKQQLALKQLLAVEEEQSMNPGKELLTMPILDAFNGPLRPANRWLPQLPWNNNFRQVARFDRCETCHLGMERSLPGQPTQPAYPPIHRVTIELPTPDKAPGAASAPAGAAAGGAAEPNAASEPPTLQSVYGIRLAATGIFDASDVTVSAVYPKSAAAAAGLMAGDVIEAIGDARLRRPAEADEYLLQNVQWGAPLKLTVRRGVPEPYTSHPRLDLFVGSTSPHPVDSFGCTICHQGQGSETAFKWATHTPDNLLDAKKWTRDYDWFKNENWTYPMFSRRFVESGCLKCHHEVVDLEASRKFPDPPAPKLVEGYEVIRRYGCFGCHEINGFNGPANRIGPDMRLEPNYFAAAAQLLTDPGLAKLGKQAVGWADAVARHPEDNRSRQLLYELVAVEGAKAKDGKPTVLKPSSLRMEAALKEVESPGTIRKVGPSLRHVASKVGYDFLTSWIANPRDFRPDTRMPRFFGLWDHLQDATRGLKESQRLEPIEIRALAEYLLGASQPFAYAQMPAEPQAGAEREQAIARGKKVFELRGCLACHQHADFPKGVATQGPNLSRIGAKLATNPDGGGRKWLYSWLRDPKRYHARTLMPNLFLDPIAAANGTTTDPAADVTEFLMNSRQDWKPAGKYPRELTAQEDGALMELALSYLQDKFPVRRAKGFLYHGIPPAMASDLVGDEAVLVNPELKNGEQSVPPGFGASGAATGDGSFAYDVLREDRNEVVPADEEPKNAGQSAGVGKQPAGHPRPNMQPESTEHKRKRLARAMGYVGRRTIGKLGCYACHDIPGYEDARPIGTALADWGRKDPSRLAFEQIAEYVNPGKKSVEELHLTPDQAYFTDHLLEEDRIGFLWEKLHSPRSYDYKKTEERPYNARLRMPQFTFAVAPEKNDQRIESVMTFVLGLVAEPPAAAYVARPGLPDSAIVQGRKVLEQFNCMGCHILEMDRWEIEYQAGDFGKPPKSADYPFLAPHFTPEQIEKSQVADRRGRLRATLIGMPLESDRDGSPVRVDEDGAPIQPGDTTSQAFRPFMLFDNMLLNGNVREVGGPSLKVAEEQIVHQYPPLGGDLARLLFPVVVRDAEKVIPDIRSDQSKANEAWGWLPPPLVGEGRKVQTDWVHDFLLDPFRIRPAAVLRMPKFNMSSPEASTLAHYFAAHDGGEYPYEFNERRDDDYVQAMEKSHPKYLEEALAVVTDNNYCIKCHLLGDFSPAGSPVGLAPRLERVGNRLRPEYVLRWLANPVRTLPYTGMPVNIPFVKPPDKPLDKLFPGTSDQQLNGVVDLLMNFDRFARSQISYKSRIKSPAPAAPPAAAKPAAIPPAVNPPFRAASG